jgi:hypothetical protein
MLYKGLRCSEDCSVVLAMASPHHRAPLPNPVVCGVHLPTTAQLMAAWDRLPEEHKQCLMVLSSHIDITVTNVLWRNPESDITFRNVVARLLNVLSRVY